MSIKVEIYKDRMVLTESTRVVTVHPLRPYFSRRLLVGSFDPAVECLKRGLTELGVFGLFKSKPKIQVYAREMAEGGLSEVEHRCLAELAYTAGAGEVEVVE
ncbi:hypothetical protein GCM10027428_05270 [Haliea atlantica]